MTPTLLYDAPVTESALLSFDGRVLEVFGYVDAEHNRRPGLRTGFSVRRVHRGQERRTGHA
ncbi:hypothetical protein ACQ86D_03785 [Streptomyces galilaeus]